MSHPATVPGGVPFDGAPRAAAPSPDGVAVPRTRRRLSPWYLAPIGASAFIAIWSGWVGIGGMTGFGKVNLLPGIGHGLQINSAITLPLGMEAYAAYAIHAAITPGIPPRAREFAKWSSVAAIVVGMIGQTTFHLLSAIGAKSAPWPVTLGVSCLPVLVLGMAVMLAHLMSDDDELESVPPAPPEPVREVPPAHYATVRKPEPRLEDTQPMPRLVPTPKAEPAVKRAATSSAASKPGTRRPKAETLRLIQEARKRRPDATQAAIAAEVGCSDRYLRQVLRSA